MEFNWLDPPAIVESKKKYSNFTITPIGGPLEIEAWREMQSAKESMYRVKLAAKDARIKDFELELGQPIDYGQVQGRTWNDKVADAKEARRKLAQAEENVRVYPPWEPIEEPKPSLWSRFKSIIGATFQ